MPWGAKALSSLWLRQMLEDLSSHSAKVFAVVRDTGSQHGAARRFHHFSQLQQSSLCMAVALQPLVGQGSATQPVSPCAIPIGICAINKQAGGRGGGRRGAL